MKRVERQKLAIKQMMPDIKKLIEKAYNELQAEYHEYLEVCEAVGLEEHRDFADWCGAWLESKGWIMNEVDDGKAPDNGP